MADAPAPVDPARVLSARDDVLNAPEFQIERDLQSRLWDWFVESIEDIAGFLPGMASVLALVLVLAGVAFVMFWVLRPAWQRERLAAGPSGAIEVTAAFASLRAQALAALAAGQLAEAVRSAWLAALALLDERGVSRRRVTRTDWEHVAAARRTRGALGEPLAALATMFQRSRFGGRPLERADAEACLDELARLATLAEAAPETPSGERGAGG